jgi:hypothetical protein
MFTGIRMFRLTVLVFTAVLVAAGVTAQRRDAFVASRDHAAIRYSSAPTADAVAALNARLAKGAASLQFDPVSGYLRSVLQALDVPVESQTLVFSQTSFQGPRINVRNPRALYFNDRVAVGWVRGGDILELTAHDPRQGVIFYQLDQDRSAAPRFTRNDDCLACHLSWETLGVPGLTVHSVHPLPDEKSYVNGYTTSHISPIHERWGGWYVTGQPGRTAHMGNIPVMPADQGRLKLDNPVAPLASVKGLFDLNGYPSPHSDVVALLVLDHQMHMTNLITRAGWEARVAQAEPGADAAGRVREAAVELANYMLFGYETPLSGPVSGSTGFAKVFAAAGPRDPQGRSLRDFDLRRRLFRYPCSYMIYSEAFDALPRAVRDAVYERMWEVLSGRDTQPRHAHLSAADRRAIVEILRATKKDLPAYFKAA